ncbi:MAG: hypothetical protein KJ060_20890 [Candidatus Hydrogenedentes bacterium]|nr:hypothetical protein [Candidatus Hydrogenedentota bacterium]
MYAKRFVIVVSALVLFLAPQVLAHRLVENDGTHVDAASALAVVEPGVSQLILHEVSENNQEVWLTFGGTAGDSVYLQLGVPVIENLSGYLPAVALVGPGLPSATVPFDLPNGTGALTFESSSSEVEFFSEPFTGTESWIYVEEDVTLPSTGTYYIVGYHPEDAAGKLWVAFGREEQFGISDILAYPKTLRTVRSFHEVSDEPLGIIPRLFLIVAAITRLFAFVF